MFKQLKSNANLCQKLIVEGQQQPWMVMAPVQLLEYEKRLALLTGRKAQFFPRVENWAVNNQTKLVLCQRKTADQAEVTDCSWRQKVSRSLAIAQN